MDGIHDLGGKHGYGAVDVNEPDEPFHHPWEAREWGISRCARTPDITIDWWRHCRELINPEDYLSRAYFDSWAQTDFATYLDAGYMSLQEVEKGQADPDQFPRQQPPAKQTLQQLLASERACAVRFDAEIDAQPLYAIGQVVETIKHGHAGHTRLPQYARNCRAIIHARHGAHVLPDLSAKGIEVHQHLYSVKFATIDLWPECEGSKDSVFLDLWESYLHAVAD